MRPRTARSSAGGGRCRRPAVSACASRAGASRRRPPARAPRTASRSTTAAEISGGRTSLKAGRAGRRAGTRDATARGKNRRSKGSNRTGEQRRPGVAGSAAMGRFGGGLRLGCGRRGRRGPREGGDGRAQRWLRRQHVEVAMTVDPRRRHQRGTRGTRRAPARERDQEVVAAVPAPAGWCTGSSGITRPNSLPSSAALSGGAGRRGLWRARSCGSRRRGVRAGRCAGRRSWPPRARR